MISERSELLARLLRYHALTRSVVDPRARDALQAAIRDIEKRLVELEEMISPPAANRNAAATLRRS
jgi:hypothetical protein